MFSFWFEMQNYDISVLFYLYLQRNFFILLVSRILKLPY